MDLEADYQDSNQSLHKDISLWPPTSPMDGQKRTLRGARHLTERDILSQLRSWLLAEYVAPYCRSLAAIRIFRHCYWIDALDGITRTQLTATLIEQNNTPAPTATANGHGRKKSAPQALHEYPLILQPTIKLSQELALESKPIKLHSLFLTGGNSSAKRRNGQGESHTSKETHNGNISSVESPLLLPAESSILPQSWLEVAPQLLPAIEQSPAIFLLNPLTPILFTESDLVPLFRRATPTELCLFLSHKQILAYLQATRKATPVSQTIATTFTNLLRTDRWKTLIPENEGMDNADEGRYEQAINSFIELLSTSLKRHFTFPILTMPIPVLSGPATVEDAQYTLLFATKRQASLFSMNDAICRYRRRLEEDSYHGVLGEEWFRTQQQDRYNTARQQLAQRILQQGRAQRARRWPDLRQQLLLTLFGQFPTQDYDGIIQQLLLNKDVHCTWRKSSPIEETGGVPGNEDTLTWS
jgi:hypothetical protein